MPAGRDLPGDDGGPADGGTPADPWQARWKDAPPRERHAWLVGFVRDAVVRVARCDPSRPPDRRQRLSDLGLDSLMAIELRDWLATGLAIATPLPATLMFDYPTIDAIAGHLEHRLLDGAPVVDDGAAPPMAATVVGADTARASRPAPSPSPADVTAMSDAEVEALLAAKLRALADGDTEGELA